MTRIQATANYPTALDWRQKTFSKLGNYSELAEKPWSELREFEIFPGTPLRSPLLTVPTAWLPSGKFHRLSFREIDPTEVGVPGDAAVAARRDESIRRALLALWLPGMTDTGVRSWSPSTWVGNAKNLLRLAKWEFDNPLTEDGTVFRGFTVPVMINRVFPEMAPKQNSRDDLLWVLSRLIEAGDRGVISDWPDNFEATQERSSTPTIEDVVVGASEIVRVELVEERHYQPFSDRFVTEFMRRALWFFENVAEPAIRLWLELRKVPEALGLESKHEKVIAARNDLIATYPWVDSEGQALVTVPFELHYVDGPSAVWPPRGMVNLNRIITLVQTMTTSIVALCTGARSSEIAAARDDDQQGLDGRFYSRTFKFIDRLGGEPRDWPLHPLAVRALRVQQILARGVRTEGDHLWVTIHGGRPLLNLTEPLVQAVSFLGLNDLTGGDRAHMHRWRHTVARLVAASVMSAPQVLLDLFGHSDLEMTLTYMCSDPDIVDLALKIAEETAFVVSGEAVVDTMTSKAGGPAAEKLRTNLNAMAMRRGEQEFATKDLRETLEVMTFNGRTWSLVRPGVICTKAIGQFGPCTRGRGAPDPATCRTSCDHRLETARAKRDCHEALGHLISERAYAMETGFDMLTARLDGEILSHLNRFDDVREQVLRNHPDLATLWSGTR